MVRVYDRPLLRSSARAEGAFEPMFDRFAMRTRTRWKNLAYTVNVRVNRSAITGLFERVVRNHFASRAMRRLSTIACQSFNFLSSTEPSDRRTTTRHRDRIMTVIGRSTSLGPISRA